MSPGDILGQTAIAMGRPSFLFLLALLQLGGLRGIAQDSLEWLEVLLWRRLSAAGSSKTEVAVSCSECGGSQVSALPGCFLSVKGEWAGRKSRWESSEGVQCSAGRPLRKRPEQSGHGLTQETVLWEAYLAGKRGKY